MDDNLCLYSSPREAKKKGLTMKLIRSELGRLTAVRAVVVAATMVLASCGGARFPGADAPGPMPVVVTPTPTPVVVDGQGAVSDGQSVAIASSSSPINGAKVEIGADTLPGDAETITITYQDNLPEDLSPAAAALGGQPISKVLILTRTGTADFGNAVTVTVPYDTSKVLPGSVPIAVVWDESTSSYSPVMISSIDEASGLITFETSHFSKYSILVLDSLAGTTRPASTALTVDVGFTPGVDGFFVHNFGSYDAVGGNSFGMAAYAAWYHKAKKASKGAGLYTLYLEGNLALEEDDLTVRELITRAYQLGSQKAHVLALNKASKMNTDRGLQDWLTGASLISQMTVTKQAQILAMGESDGNNGWKNGHTVTVYAYDGTNKVFKLYDSNFPNEVVLLPWDPKDGFVGTMPKNYKFDRFAFAAFNTAYSSGALSKLFDAVESGWASSKFPKISITSPTELTNVKGTFEVVSDVNVTITGTVPRAADAPNQSAQRYVHVYLNGTKFGNPIVVDNANNGFSIPIAKLPIASGTDVMLLVSESNRSWGEQGFSAFKQFKVRVANSYFFKNFGFETGSFSDWLSETYTWSNATRRNPQDSAVVETGFDLIATDLPKTLFGARAARINDQANGAHISSMTQKAVVPTAANPVIRFYWAAVLQDPNHDPDEQPYVDVTVTNKTKTSLPPLYTRHFYSNDPNYTGWKPYQNGSWKSIPWQLVEIPVAAYIGDEIEVKVVAADCQPTGHGGYVYLDTEE